jgi:O-antigen/teichoic acid export membrane protein
MDDNLKEKSGIGGLSKIGFSYIIAQIIYGVFWFSIAPILGKESFGEVSYFIAIANIASTIAFIGAGNTILVFTPKKIHLEAEIFSITLISSIITSIVLFIFLRNIEISLFVIGFVIFGLSINEILARQYYKKYAKYLITQRVIQVGLSYLFYLILGPMGIILGFAISYFIYINRVRIILKEKKNFSLLNTKKGFMSNSYLLDLSRTFSIYTDKLIVLPIFGFAVLGSYQLGIQYLTVLAIFPNIVFQYILPQDAAGNENKKIKKITIIASIGFTFISIILVPIVFPIFFEEFQETVQIIQILSLSIIPKTVSMMYMSKFLSSEKSKVVAISSGIFLAIQVSGILFLGNTLGIHGVAWALVIASCGESIFLFLIKHKNNS